MVLCLKKTIGVKVMGLDVEVPFEPAYSGMIPVFDTKERAEEWADGKFDVVELRIPSEVRRG